MVQYSAIFANISTLQILTVIPTGLHSAYLFSGKTDYWRHCM